MNTGNVNNLAENKSVNLEIFKHIDSVVELFEQKRDVYKLIADEIQEYFETTVFSKSRYSLSMVHRIKTSNSIREKLVRNSYISSYSSDEEVLNNFQDLLGFRIECKFIDDEKYVYELIKSIFSASEDGIYFYEPDMPKIRLKLSDHQPQKQRNGFDIYKIDGAFLLGRDTISFELQIKALVNNFWGDIEHKIIYKNHSYQTGDNFVQDLMTSIKKSLNMIDSQLYVLYKRFTRSEKEFPDKTNLSSIENFISRIVYDTFIGLMKSQVGFAIDFKNSCDAVVRYIMEVNNAQDLEDYGRVMLNVFYTLSSVQENPIRVDTQVVFDRELFYDDVFSFNIYQASVRLININYKWHLFFLMLFTLERGKNADDLESFIRYYKNAFLKNRSFEKLEKFGSQLSHTIQIDMLNTFSEVFKECENIDYVCQRGMGTVHAAINSMVPCIVNELNKGKKWDEIKVSKLAMLRQRMMLQDI